MIDHTHEVQPEGALILYAKSHSRNGKLQQLNVVSTLKVSSDLL